MQPIIKLGLTKDYISSTLHTAVRYGTCSIGDIRIFYPFVIQGTVRIAFLIEHYWKSTPSRSLLRENLSTLQMEAGRGRRILENNYMETQQLLQTDSWVLEVGKLMSANQINISHLVPELATQRTYDA